MQSNMYPATIYTKQWAQKDLRHNKPDYNNACINNRPQKHLLSKLLPNCKTTRDCCTNTRKTAPYTLTRKRIRKPIN